MLYLRYGLYLMALSAGLWAPKVRTDAGKSVHHSLLRRFLFSTAGGMGTFCSVCFLQCSNGYVQFSTGCYLCECSTNYVTTSNSLASYYTTAMVNGGIFLNNPCNPAVRHCHYQCTLGYKLGTNGCQYCVCNEPPSTARPAVTNATASHSNALTSRGPTSTTFSPPIVSTTPVSRISHAPFQTTTSLLATTAATSGSDGKTDGYMDPCISTLKTCSIHCPGGYVKGPEGCQYCLCMPASMATTTPTPDVPVAGAALPTHVPPYLDLTPTSEACIMAKVICNEKCPSGFVSRPDDCLYCACRPTEQVYDDPETDVIELETPCLSHRNQCRLLCLAGYVAGPKDCQFCACA